MSRATTSRQGLGTKLGFILFGFTGLLMVVVGASFVVLHRVSRDATVSNLAGRQRMLSQKLGLHALQVDAAIRSGAVEGLGEQRGRLQKTRQLFETTLNGLLEGGGVTGTGGELVVIAPVRDERARAQLAKVRALWESVASQLDALQDPARHQAGVAKSGAAFGEGLEELLRESNVAVTYLQAVTDERMELLRFIQIGAVVLGLLSMLLAWRLWVRRHIAMPLATVSEELAHASVESARASREIAASSERVLAASTSQAAAIQEAVAAMNQITAMVGQTTSRADTSAKEANEALNKTHAGKAVIAEMNGAMRGLAEANDKLEQIVRIFTQISHKTNVINDIAFKTKMLSINAAVEAARAGQHGRGFSVVASEVGNLSKLSADAATDIRDLLSSSQQEVGDIIRATSNQVESGSRVTTAVEQAFSDIARAVQEVAQQAAAISQAASEQELGVKQTASGIEQIHSQMMETRAEAEKSRGAMSAIRAQSERLTRIGQNLQVLVHGGEAEVLAAVDRSGERPSPRASAPGSDLSASDDDRAAALVSQLGAAARRGRSAGTLPLQGQGSEAEDFPAERSRTG